MNPDKESPCKYGLTPECFEEYPEFAKQAFAIRLLCLLVDCEITSKLPGKLGKLLSIPKWGPGYPWPDAPFWWDTITMPEYARKTGPDSPLFLSPWHPGRGSPVASAAARGRKYAWWDYFHSLDTDEWTLAIVSEGTIDVVSDKLRIQKEQNAGQARIYRTDAKAVYPNFLMQFDLTFISGASWLYIESSNSYRLLYARFKLPDVIEVYNGTTFVAVTVDDFTNVEHTWGFNVAGGLVSVYEDSVLKGEDLSIPLYGSYPGRQRFSLMDIGNVRIDDYYWGEV